MIKRSLETEQIFCSNPGSRGLDIPGLHEGPMYTEYTNARVPSWFSGYMLL